MYIIVKSEKKRINFLNKSAFSCKLSGSLVFYTLLLISKPKFIQKKAYNEVIIIDGTINGKNLGQVTPNP